MGAYGRGLARRLPRRTIATPPPPPTWEMVERGGGLSMAQRDVLIADDDGQVSEVLRQVFVAAGYNCLLARDVPEGLADEQAIEARSNEDLTDRKSTRLNSSH